MAAEPVERGYFSLLRWRVDPTRDEARNVAVLLVDKQARFGGIRHAPLSVISPRLRDQGIIDELLLGLEQRFENGFGLSDLQALRGSLQRSLVVTEPQAVAVEDEAAVLSALYRAYVAPRSGGGRALTKGAVLDRVVTALRGQGLNAKRGAYLGEFIFDVVVEESARPTVYEVLSFGVDRKDWTPVEREAGHFLYALGKLDVAGQAVIQPPQDENGATASYERVRRWLGDEHVPIVEPEELVEAQLTLQEPRR